MSHLFFSMFLAAASAVPAAPSADASPPLETTTAARPANPEDETLSRVVLSAHGPGSGHAAFSFGATFVSIIPLLETRLLWNPVGILDIDTHVRALGVLYQGEVGARLRLVQHEHFSVAARAGVEAVTFLWEEGAEGSVALKPGLLLSTGGRTWQLTLEGHVPLLVATNQGAGVERGVINVLEASFGAEFPSTIAANFVVQLTMLIDLEESIALPLVTVAASF